MSLVPEESAPPQDVRERAPFALTSTLPPGSFEQITRLSVLCLCGVTFAVFAQGLFGSFVWDDLFLIVQNRHVREGGVLEAFSSDFWHISSAIGAEVAYYRPLVTLSYVLEWRLYGDRPFGYHVTNLALHLVCVWLAFKWLYARLSTEHQVERAWQALAGAMAGALLFAVHPSRVEVVSWISGRTDSMMAALVLLGLVLFQRSQLRLRGLAAGVAFALALLCKEAMITVPVCLALDALLREPPERRREALRQAGSALGVTLLALALRFAFAPAPAHNTRSIFAQPLERVASTIGHYAESVLWPVHPSMLTALQRYDATGRIAYSQSSIVLGTLCVLALLGLLWAARYSERARPWLADALWFVIPLLPVINIVPLNLKPLVANRFLYLPMLGVAALLARALAAAVGRPGPRAPATVISMVIAFVACIVVTTRYLPAFATDEASIAYEHALHPEDTMLLADLANRQAGRGQLHEALLTALEGYKAAAQQREHTPRIRFLLLAARYLNDGLHDHQHTELRALDAFYSALEQGQEARLEVPPLRIVTQLGDKDRAMLRRDIDDFVVPRAMLAARMGNLPLAIAQLSRAGQEDSRQARAFRMLALLLERSEQHEAALGALARAEAAAPAHAETILIRKRITDAHALFERAAADPAQGVVARAHAFLILGSPALAARTMDAALASQPDEPLFLATRARIDAIDGNFAAARGRVQAAQTRLPARAEDFAAVLREIEAAEDQASAKN